MKSAQAMPSTARPGGLFHTAAVTTEQTATVQASKAAMTHLMKSTAASYGERGICAVALYPSSIFEGMWKVIDPLWGELEGLPPGEMGRRRTSESILGRYETPEEVAAVAMRVATRVGMAYNGKIVVTTPTVRDN